MKQENINIKLKLDKLIKHYADGNLSHFAKILGEKPQTVFAWGVRGKLQVEKIIAAFPDLSAEWLLRDRGPMTLSEQQTNELDSILISPAELSRLRTLLAEQDQLIASMQRIIALLKDSADPQLPIPENVEGNPYSISSLHIPASEMSLSQRQPTIQPDNQ